MRRALQQELGQSGYRRERIVQLVSHAGDQLPDRRHLVVLNDLGLEQRCSVTSSIRMTTEPRSAAVSGAAVRRSTRWLSSSRTTSGTVRSPRYAACDQAGHRFGLAESIAQKLRPTSLRLGQPRQCGPAP